MTAQGKSGVNRWTAVLLLALALLGGVVAWVATRGAEASDAGPVQEDAALAPSKAGKQPSALRPPLDLPDAATAVVRPGAARVAAGSAPPSPSDKPAGLPVTTEQLRSRDFRRGTGLKQFADTVKLELQRCLGKVYVVEHALVHLTFRRDSGARAGGPDRFFPVSLSPAAGQLSASARQCLEGLRSVPLSIEQVDFSEEKFFAVPMTLPLPASR